MNKLEQLMKAFCCITFAVLFSCANDENENNDLVYDGEKYALNVSLSAFGTSVDDEAISSVRILVFTDEGRFVCNERHEITSNSELAGLTVTSALGKNHFYVLCNETPELTEKLNAVRTRNQIEGIDFNAVGIVPPLPMYGKALDVQVTLNKGDENVTVTMPDGSSSLQKLSVTLTRLMSKIDLMIIKNLSISNDFVVEKITAKYSRMPNYSFIGAGIPYEGTEWGDNLTTEGEGTLDSNGEYIKLDDKYTVSQGTDFVKFPAFYIPEHIHSDKSNGDRSTYITLEATCRSKKNSSVFTSVYQLDLGHQPPANFDLLRNVNYQIYATITQPGALGLHAVIVPMDEKNVIINWDPVDGLILVSDKIADYGMNINPWSDYASYSGLLKIVQGKVYKDAVFKYGSVIAIHGTGGNAEFAAADVLWKPEDVTPPASWSAISSMTAGEAPTSNTPEKVKLGLGDPCRLVGLSPQQIRDGKVDNGIWRMATEQDYQHLIDAKVGTDSRGYVSYQYLLLPNMAYRNENGQLSTSGGWGNYWASSNAQSFNFESATGNGSFSVGNVNRAHAIRCVRHTIPTSQLSAFAENVTYAGGKSKISVLFVNDVPYWKATLTDGDAGAFSFDDNKTEGHFSGALSATVQQANDPYTDREFKVTIKGYGLDGVTHHKELIIKQFRKEHYFNFTSISPEPPLQNGFGWIPAAGGRYEVTAALDNDPPDMAAQYPQARWYVSMDVTVGSITHVKGSVVKYGEPSVITIPANDAGDVRTVMVRINMESSSQFPPTRIALNREYIQSR